MNHPNGTQGWGVQGGDGGGSAGGHGPSGPSGSPDSWQTPYQPQDSWNLPDQGRYPGPGPSPEGPGYGVPAPGGTPEGRGRRSRAGLVIGGLVLAIVLVLGTIGVLIFRDGRGGDEQPTARVDGGAAATSETTGSEASSPTATTEESTSQTSSSTSVSPTSTSASPTSSAAPVDEGAEIRAMLDDFTVAFLRRDTATLVSMYCTADAGGPGRYEETFGFLEQHTGMSVEQAAQEYAPMFHVNHLRFEGDDAVGLTQLDFTSPSAQAAGVQPIWVIERGFRKEGGRWTVCDAAQG